MGRKASMEEIAKKLGVSKNTVSLAMRGMPGVSEQTRKLIIDTARQAGYEYKGKSDRAPVQEASRNICLVLSRELSTSAGFYSNIQFGIENEAKKNNLNTILYYYNDMAEEFEVPLCIKQGIISGVITLGHISRNTLDALTDLGLPFVVIDEYFDSHRLDYILTDNIGGGFAAVEYLIRRGHREIGFYGGIHRASSFYDRYLGCLKALETYRLPIESSYLLTGMSPYSTDEDALQDETAFFRSMKQLPTAFFCCNDPAALALYRIFSAMGLKIPGDISIIGFDDVDSSTEVSPQLTTMRVEKEAMGRRSVIKLLEKFDNKISIPEKIILSTVLVERQSVRNLAEKPR